jgi:RNA 2',3'-cyclic 3'-phosphodiesterase
MIRTFICIELPESLKARLETLENQLRSKNRSAVSWVKPSNIHLTLRFLGDIDEGRQAELREAVERVVLSAPAFKLCASKTGVFPNPRNPRVFWIGIKGAEEHLIPMQKRLEQELEKAGFGKQDKPFSPHLTIGRARERNAQELAELLQKIDFTDEEFIVSEIIIMRSDLKPTGAVYSKLAVIKLQNS